MTEKQLREKLVATAVAWLGCKESDGSHRKIIDTYNSHKPLARGYAVKYTDAWCSTYASAVAIKADMTDIVPLECGCEKHIQLFKSLGRWQENDAYVPQPGDYIFYDWDDSGAGDCTGAADHVGIVTAVSGSNITIIEGNRSDSVSYRTMQINGRYIRGYGVPDYAGKAKKMGAASPAETTAKGAAHAVGEIVNFTGKKHYTSANAVTGKACTPGKAKITQIYNPESAKHPYHLVSVSGGGSNVYGWVDAADIDATTAKADPVAGAISDLVAAGVITTPEYWRNLVAAGTVKYLDTLLIKMAEKVKSTK